jgi:hypothetical protein
MFCGSLDYMVNGNPNSSNVVRESPQITLQGIAGVAADDAANPDPDRAKVAAIGLGVEVGVAACVAGGCEAAVAGVLAKGASWAAKILGIGTKTASKNLLGRVTGDLAERGFDAPKIQNIIGWGSRASGASARLESMDGAAAASEARAAGMTRSMVQSLRNGYQDAATRGRGAGVAQIRVQILDKILANW